MKRIATLLAYLEEILFLADLFPRLIADHRKNGLRFFFFFIYIFFRELLPLRDILARA